MLPKLTTPPIIILFIFIILVWTTHLPDTTHKSHYTIYTHTPLWPCT